MTRRQWLRRRLLWAGVLLGLVALLVAVSALRICVWGRDLLMQDTGRLGRRAIDRKGGKMTRTLTLIFGIAVAAMAIVPVALGEGRLAPPSAPSQAAMYGDAGARPAALPSGLDLAAAVGRLDVSTVQKAFTTYRDAGERATPVGTSVGTTVETPSVASGRDLDWAQLGVGFTLGIVLVIGLGLAVQAVRPVAH